jgi:hypothetical protein
MMVSKAPIPTSKFGGESSTSTSESWLPPEITLHRSEGLHSEVVQDHAATSSSNSPPRSPPSTEHSVIDCAARMSPIPPRERRGGSVGRSTGAATTPMEHNLPPKDSGKPQKPSALKPIVPSPPPGPAGSRRTKVPFLRSSNSQIHCDGRPPGGRRGDGSLSKGVSAVGTELHTELHTDSLLRARHASPGDVMGGRLGSV